VATQLVASKVSGCTTAQSTHQATIALGLGIGVGWSVTWSAGLAICVLVLALWILVCGVCALLGELILRLRARVGSLLWLTIVARKY
jgi:hypothetical protein